MSIGTGARHRFLPLFSARAAMARRPSVPVPARLLATAGTDPAVDAAFWRVLGRPPTVRESAEWVERAAALRHQVDPSEVEALIAQALKSR